MKKIVLMLLFGAVLQATAQIPFTDRDSIDANNINALSLVHGDMWWATEALGGAAHCRYPNSSQKNVGFASALWMSGYDASGQLHVAAQTYRQDGNDYWPGPLDGSGSLDYPTSQKWAKIWKVKRTDINSFLALATHDVSNTPSSILTWPGKGNVYAAGKAGAALTVSTSMAPFTDLNGNGNYEPLNGEYPLFYGEQALWWVFSDNGPTHTQSDGLPLKVEVQVMAYAFKRNTLIDNVVYYDYTMVNKSAENYNNFRLALWSDVDLGYYLDDFIGFDSSHRMGVTYNAINNDGSPAGNPPNSYGLNPPIVGVTIVHMPGDIGGSYVPAGSFMYNNNDPSPLGNPMVDTEFNFYMRSRWRNGTHLTNTFTGSGTPNSGYGPGPECNYVFSGDPTTSGGWDECTSGNNPGDRRYIIASNNFTLNAGSKQKIVMALVVDSAGGGCPVMNLTGIKEVADTAWGVYHTLPNAVTEPAKTTKGNSIVIYPNPATDKLVIDGSAIDHDVQVKIYNVLGQVVDVALCKHGLKNTVDVSNYPTGTYIVSYPQSGLDKKAMFMKE